MSTYPEYQQADQRCQDVVDERLDHHPERGRDDEGDGQVNDVAAEQEIAKLLEHRFLLCPRLESCRRTAELSASGSRLTATIAVALPQSP